ncbi:MAG: hypothetical protein RI973_556 [Bacteroidota bacterium]|jgi:hypothetical protein
MNPASQLHWRPISAIFLSLLILFYTTGCSYFNVRTASTNELPKLAEIGKSYNYFILHTGENQNGLHDLRLEEGFLKGNLVAEPDVPVHYYKGRSYRYRPSEEKSILHEVHIYLKNAGMTYKPGEVEIPIEEIREIVVIDPDTGTTVVSYVFTTAGIVVATLLLLSVIILLAKGSCPYVYTFNGQTFVFEGETYSGAIFRGLERDDCVPLPHLKPDDGLYKVRIANELKERQFTNLANLTAVNHPAGTRVLPDASGAPRLITRPKLPLEATTEGGLSYASQMAAADHDVFMFNEDTDSNRLYLTFDKPAEARRAKLVLNLKNTLWGDFVYGEFSKKFGATYMQWIDRQNQIPAEDLPHPNGRPDFKLVASLKTTDGWKEIAQLQPVGPMGSRNVVIPMDLPAEEADKLQIRLSSGFMFWEIDQAAMDFTEDDGLDLITLQPLRAFGSGTRDSKAALSHADDLYLEQLQTGEVTELHFQVPPPPSGMEQSFFLHTRGYYNHVRDYTGLPDLEALEPFKKPGYFSRFSRELYREMAKEEALARVNKTQSLIHSN